MKKTEKQKNEALSRALESFPRDLAARIAQCRAPTMLKKKKPGLISRFLNFLEAFISSISYLYNSRKDFAKEIYQSFVAVSKEAYYEYCRLKSSWFTRSFYFSPKEVRRMQQLAGIGEFKKPFNSMGWRKVGTIDRCASGLEARRIMGEHVKSPEMFDMISMDKALEMCEEIRKQAIWENYQMKDEE